MRNQSLASDWLTTGGVARELELSPEGVRHLVRTKQLACERTPTGQRLFRQGEVMRLVQHRAQARGAGVTMTSRRASAAEPRQLWLAGLPPMAVRQLAKAKASLEEAQAKGSGSGGIRAWV